MTCRRRVVWPTWLALALVALAAAPPAPAQEGQANKGKVRVPPHGVQGFTRILHAVKLQPLTSIEEFLKADPKDTVVIVFGDPSPLARLEEARLGPAAFVEKGGALLVATDRKTGNLLDDFEVEVVGDVVVQVQEQNAYKGLRDCPLITRVERDHPLIQGVRRLATINPSQVAPRHRGLFVSRLAFFPDGCQSNQGIFLGAPFMMGSDAASRHRVLVMGGHSPFMNVLVAQPDNDNFAFAINTVRWLTDHGRRKRCLFVYDGSVATKYDVPLGGIPMPTEELINRFLARLEREGFFERLAEAILPRGLVPRLLLFGASLFLAIYLFFRVWGRRHEAPREAPLLSSKVAQTVPDRTVLALRQQALVHEDNLWEVARALARQCFERHGVGAPGPGAVPEVRASGSRDRRRRVLALWKLAYGKPGRAVRTRDFARVLADVEAVDEWLADDAVRLTFPARPDHPRRGRVSPEVSTN